MDIIRRAYWDKRKQVKITKYRLRIWNNKTEYRICRIRGYKYGTCPYFVSSAGQIMLYNGKGDFSEIESSIKFFGRQLYIHTMKKSVYYRIDEIVAGAWKRGTKKYRYIEHKDGNKYNCNAGNLRWVENRPKGQRTPSGVLVKKFGVLKGKYTIPEFLEHYGVSAYKLMSYCNLGETLSTGETVEWIFENDYRKNLKQYW